MSDLRDKCTRDGVDPRPRRPATGTVRCFACLGVPAPDVASEDRWCSLRLRQFLDLLDSERDVAIGAFLCCAGRAARSECSGQKARVLPEDLVQGFGLSELASNWQSVRRASPDVRLASLMAGVMRNRAAHARRALAKAPTTGLDLEHLEAPQRSSPAGSESQNHQDRLTARQRAAIEAFHCTGSYAEAGIALGSTKQSVRRILWRAAHRLSGPNHQGFGGTHLRGIASPDPKPGTKVCCRKSTCR